MSPHPIQTLLFCLLAASACSKAITPLGGSQDASTGNLDAAQGIYVSACLNLRALGCVEGKDGRCVETLRKAVEARLTNVDARCLSRARTPELARACGGGVCAAAK
jgi:hypothetical protein